MKPNPCPSYLIYFTFLLSLLTVLPWQVQANSHEAQSADHSEKTCLTGWLPIQHSQNSSCLQIVRCFDEISSEDVDIDKNKPPLVTESSCPENLQQTMAIDSNVTALVNILKGNHTQSEYISAPSLEESPSWFYGWSAANFGMSLLHIFKANQKATSLYNGKTSNKNIYFFASYMIGAFHHIFEMPAAMVSQYITWMPHLLMHAGTLTLSIIERIKDCNCCGQFKNGHNTMIVFHLVALAFAALW